MADYLALSLANFLLQLQLYVALDLLVVVVAVVAAAVGVVVDVGSVCVLEPVLAVETHRRISAGLV